MVPAAFTTPLFRHSPHATYFYVGPFTGKYFWRLIAFYYVADYLLIAHPTL
jgi:hypothetical protein